ncbi:MAG: sulfurtransferase [Betaproteobacteria bacterium]|nr:sulfurtransferase [Betaproteobacteria bacterium]
MGAARTEAVRTLVTGEQLARHAEWRVFDCRHDLARPAWGLAEYRKAHIPGALFAHLDRDLSAPKTGRNGRHPLPPAGDFRKFLQASGIHPADPIVCYDAGPGAFAARLWWMLRWIGHQSVAVLDGGLARWLAEGRPVTAAVPEYPATPYAGNIQGISIKVETVQAQPAGLLLLDARAPARFRGEQEPIDPVAGRIPGALNRFNNDNLRPDGTFKDPASLRTEFESILGKGNPEKVVHYCGSGVAACHNALAMEIAGLAGARVYVGSWSEWIADPARPRQKG